MARESEPRPIPPAPTGARFGIVSSTYHEDVTGAMARSAEAVLARAGVAEGDVVRVRAPGAFELPLVARRLAGRPDIDAVLCFGLVLKGETDHDRHIASAVADSLMRAGEETGKPVLFGVLTCGTLEQALARSRPLEEDGLDKGREVALAAIEVLFALRSCDEPPKDRGKDSAR